MTCAFAEKYGVDDYRIIVPSDGRPIMVSRNSLAIQWNEVPYAIRCWIYKSIDANGRSVDAHPFPQPPIVMAEAR